MKQGGAGGGGAEASGSQKQNQQEDGAPYKGQPKKFKTDRYIMQHFKPIKVIGKGSFGEVTKAIDLRTNKIRAIKKIKKSALQKEKGIDKDMEYDILTKLVRK